MISKDEVLSILRTRPNGNIEESQFKKKYTKHYQELQKWNFPEEFKFVQKLFHYFNDDPELKLGLCPVCGKRCWFQKFNRGYHIYCSRECVQNDKLIQDKKKTTCLKKYGVESYSQSNEFHKKVKQTCLERYGVEYAIQNPDIMNKSIQTCLEKYGVCNYTMTQECLNKMQQTCLERYGVKNYAQTQEYKDKITQTNFEKYGVKHYSLTQEFHDRYINFCMETYGTTNAFQSEDIKEKIKQTNFEKYGVYYYTQTNDYFKNKKCHFFSDITNETYDSSWEQILAEYCFNNNISYTYQPSMQFEYEYDNKIHHYQPDFLINGKLYEVKGDHFFDGDKMICPYNRNNYTDGLAEAKHQCMIKNNVIILRGDDIKNIKDRLK